MNPTETGLFYVGSRYYDPETGRFVNADDTDVLTSSLDVPNQDKNLFAYCDNDPVNRVDYGGDRWSWGTVFKTVAVVAAVVAVGAFVVGTGGIGALAVVGGGTALTITEAGATAFGVSAVAGTIAVSSWNNSKAYDPDSYARVGQKKQGRENKELKKKKNWESRNNKRDNKPAKHKSHKPMKDHQKY